jgi:outer membrane lipoprotein-sorting protein
MFKPWLRCGVLLFPVLTGCLSHTRKLQQSRLAGPVMDADAVQLVERINQRYEQINTLNATVDFAASVGGAHQGQQTDYTSIRGHILFRKPQMLRVLGLVPVLQTRAFDLASDGTTFTLLIPPKNRAIRGANSVTKKGKNPLENLRPEIFVDAMLIRDIPPGRIVSLIHESATTQDPKTRQLIELPEYDLTVLSGATPAPLPATVQIANPQRVIRFSRINLMPAELDIYNTSGDLETQVLYSNYQDFGGTLFPATITIYRPLDEFHVTLTVEKLTVNQPLSDDQFQLQIPAGVQVQDLK